MHLNEVNDSKHNFGTQVWIGGLMIPTLANPIWNTSENKP